ncbi:inositol-3-phosphate synthase [Engelhardtia mirabilis]|uniref:Inositol-3-phosphate synthase n=1 Tax=Engelhardtia mirabilis TaxID=2528011 RepID=A0A518BQI5_9BACT|nr:Inositol-3-phosphate synthase [Planctomycetes bacterium Pla133]QDV03565.1 Inositol-3-phosphate synthase [Planctomycetes bacterium Pla86]
MTAADSESESSHTGLPPGRRVGLWLIGGRGAISTCLVYGLRGLVDGLLEPTGLATSTAPFEGLDLAEFGNLVLGGCEVRRGTLDRAARELVRQRILDPSLVAATATEAAAYDARLAPGLLDGPDVGMADLDPESARLGGAAPREQIAAIVSQLEAFRAQQQLDRVVVVNLASTEAWRDPDPAWADLPALQRALDAGEAQPASMVYAIAAFEAGCPYVNFTPSIGASTPALRQLALEHGQPHCGNDGKTGETLVKTALAPMFAHRALKVLAWQGYNMLGNRDGEVLSDPLHRRAKIANKDEVLRQLIGHPELHTHVGIDYVPSLSDWKTAWDLVHFEGFLGTRMTLQFTWAGCDSALAAPLVLDLVRLADLAASRGESGVMEHTAGYFKSPLGGGSHDFHLQYHRLLTYAAECRVRS